MTAAEESVRAGHLEDALADLQATGAQAARRIARCASSCSSCWPSWDSGTAR